MFTYVARPRVLYKEPHNAKLDFPCLVDVAFKFEPTSTFGEKGSPSKTVPVGAKVRLGANFCKGEFTVSTDADLELIRPNLRANHGAIVFEGPTMRIRYEAESSADLQSLLETYYYCFPPLLSIDLIDSPRVSEVRGTAGKVPFCWGVSSSGSQKFDAVSRQIQEERIVAAFRRLKLVCESGAVQNRRILAATQYFYLACRLNRTQGQLWEFLAESILNEAKILEILFPGPDGHTIDSARAGLKSLDFSNLEIETLFIPAIALRNAIDVAHPQLAIFSANDAKVLYQYADQSEDAFRTLLQRVFQRIEAGTFVPPAVQDIAPSSDVRGIIKRIAENLAKYKETTKPQSLQESSSEPYVEG